MRINPDCMRAVLFYIESNLELNEHMYLDEIVRNLNTFDSNDVIYSVKQLNDSYYLNSRVFKTSNYNCAVFDITPKGHEFIENVRNDEIWKETKENANKLGSFSLEFLSNIASTLLSAYLKSQMGL